MSASCIISLVFTIWTSANISLREEGRPFLRGPSGPSGLVLYVSVRAPVRPVWPRSIRLKDQLTAPSPGTEPRHNLYSQHRESTQVKSSLPVCSSNIRVVLFEIEIQDCLEVASDCSVVKMLLFSLGCKHMIARSSKLKNHGKFLHLSSSFGQSFPRPSLKLLNCINGYCKASRLLLGKSLSKFLFCKTKKKHNCLKRLEGCCFGIGGGLALHVCLVQLRFCSHSIRPGLNIISVITK